MMMNDDDDKAEVPREEDYGHVCMYTTTSGTRRSDGRHIPCARGGDTIRRVYVTAAPDRACISPGCGMLSYVHEKGEITITGENGSVTYQIDGVSQYGSLLCTKINDTCSSYVVPLSAPNDGETNGVGQLL